MQLKQAFKSFILNQKAGGNSPATVQWYESIMGAFIRKVGNVDLCEITPDVLRVYLAAFRATPAYKDAPQKPQQAERVSPNTVNAHHRALVGFWNWAAREYAIRNPMENIPRVKAGKPKPKSVTAHDVVRMLELAGDDLEGIRNRLLVSILADSGVRIGGLMGVTLADVDMDLRRFVVTSKGDTYTAFFTLFTRGLLERWLEVRPSVGAESLFVSIRTGEPLTESGAYQALQRLKRDAGATGRVNPHAFRHGYARTYIENGGDISTLARLLNNSIEVAHRYYANLALDELQSAHDKVNPLGKMMIGASK